MAEWRFVQRGDQACESKEPGMPRVSDSGRHLRRLEGALVSTLAHFGDYQGEAVMGALVVDPDEDVRRRQIPLFLRHRKKRGRPYMELLEHALGERSALVRDAAVRFCLDHP